MAQAKVRDERLAWLAVRDELTRRSRRGPLTFLRRVFGNMAPTGTGMGTDVTAPSKNRRMRRYSFAVHDVAQRLDAGEREVLRATGRVPDWFLGAVTQRYRQLRGGRF
jgi:hypothetical protein